MTPNSKTPRFPFPKPSSALVASALSGHRALGVVLAGLVYILSVSGVLSVFNHELQRWEQPGAPAVTTIDPEAVQRASETLLAQENTTHFYVQLPTWDLPRAVLTTDTKAVFMNPDGTLAGAESHPWTQFVLDLHYYLTVPGTAGLTLVGMLGVLVFALTLSGLLSHPKIFRDAFRFRFGGQPRLTQADIHNRLGVWTAPFVLSSALTGAMLGLAAVISAGVATLDYGGDVEAVYEPVFGAEPAENEAPAPLANIGAALRFMASEHPDKDPTYVLMHEPKTEGQHLQILAEHPERLIFGDYYGFDAEGSYRGNVGMSDGTGGQQVAASVYRLHFGSFGGLPIKLAYAVFGISLAFMICAGMNIYFIRREQRRGKSVALRQAWAGVVWGTPIALTFCLLGSLVMPGLPLNVVFWAVLASVTAAAVTLRRPGVAGKLMSSMLGIGLALVALPRLVGLSGEMPEPATMCFHLALLAAAGLLLIGGRKLGVGFTPRRTASMSPPAE
jgi:uncharacterized iron-regulated membrane protein